MLKLLALLILMCPIEIQDDWLSKKISDEVAFVAGKLQLTNILTYERDMEVYVVRDSIPIVQRNFWIGLWLPWDEDRFRFNYATRDYLKFSDDFISYCKSQSELEPWKERELSVIIEETKELYYIWSIAVDTRPDNEYRVFYRRSNLAYLRSKIGESDYLDGRLPPNVPIWRFKIID